MALWPLVLATVPRTSPFLPSMATVGLGVWKAPADLTSQVVYDAISVGYRHL